MKAGEAEALEQLFVFRQRETHSQRHARRAEPPRRPLARGHQLAAEAAAPKGRKHADPTDLNRVAVGLPEGDRDETAAREGPEAAAGGELDRDRFAGLTQGRRWRAGGPALSGERGANDLGGSPASAIVIGRRTAASAVDARGEGNTMTAGSYTSAGWCGKAADGAKALNIDMNEL